MSDIIVIIDGKSVAIPEHEIFGIYETLRDYILEKIKSNPCQITVRKDNG